MADGIKGAVSDLAGEVTEAVIKPVVAEMGQVIEQAGQSVAGQPQINPHDQAKLKLEAQKKLQDQAKAQRIRKWLADLSESDRKLRLQRSQEMQKKMQVAKEDQAIKQVEKSKEFKKRSQIEEHIQRQKAKAELKGGVGG